MLSFMILFWTMHFHFVICHAACVQLSHNICGCALFLQRVCWLMYSMLNCTVRSCIMRTFFWIYLAFVINLLVNMESMHAGFRWCTQIWHNCTYHLHLKAVSNEWFNKSTSQIISSGCTFTEINGWISLWMTHMPHTYTSSRLTNETSIPANECNRWCRGFGLELKNEPNFIWMFVGCLSV